MSCKRLVDSAEEVGEIGLTVSAVGRSNAIIDAVALSDDVGEGLLAIGGVYSDGMEAFAEMAVQRLVESRLEKRQSATLNGTEALGVHLYAVNGVAVFGKA